MTIQNIIIDRQIGEVVHFTTNHGCLGTLFTGQLQSRQRLQNDEMVEYLFSPNAELRKDEDYLDHVSLSISHINVRFYSISSGKWHRNAPIFWCILAFDPVIMTHENVEFSTTNNIYTGVRRAFDLQGLEAVFAPTVTLWQGKSTARTLGMRPDYPTCAQAEVLYPSAVSTDHLQRIYVCSQTDQSEVIGFLKATFHRDVEVLIRPDKFQDRPL